MGQSFIYNDTGGFKSSLRNCDDKKFACCYNIEELLKSIHSVVLSELGVDVHIWSILRAGTVCSCYDQYTGEAETDCPICYGTGLSGGYDQVIYNESELIKLRINNLQRTLELTDTGYSVGIQSKGQLAGEPLIKNRDLIFWVDKQLMFEVYNYTPKYVAELMTLQDFNLKLLQPYEVVRKLEGL